MSNLIERLRNIRAVLKSGEYDGSDLMEAWCAAMDAADAIEEMAVALRDAADELHNAYRPEEAQTASAVAAKYATQAREQK